MTKLTLAVQPSLIFTPKPAANGRQIMRNFFAATSLVCVLALSQNAVAGNDQKRGSAGATELTVNPWARSSGWAGANSAGIRGVESMNSNIGGLAYVRGTEVLFSSTNWMSGTDIHVSSFGLGQQLGKNGGVLGLSATSWNLGDFKQTTVDNPDQDINFRATLLNFGLSYAKVFSERITGGITLRYVSQSVPNASASGVAFDGAVQYQAHIGGPGVDPDRKNFKVGVALRNVGPEMQYSGDGLTYRGRIEGGNVDASVQGQAASFEIPTSLNIGVQYDYFAAEDHRISIASTFVSNTFTNDQIQGGLEYAFMERFMVRGGYDYIKGNEQASTRSSAHTGLTAGASVEVPFGKADADSGTDEKKHRFGVDYSFRSTNPWNGTHSIGIRLVL